MRFFKYIILFAVLASFLLAAGGQAEVSTNIEKEETVVTENKSIKAVFATSKGNIVIELNEEKAPLTVKNFVQYIEDGFYNGTTFHRVIPNFVIQGGGFEPGMKQKKTREPIKNEADNGLKNDRGAICMARTNVVDSATSQFFINLKDNEFLNYRGPNPQTYGYCVFGKVVEGLDVVDEIAKVKTTKVGHFSDVPEKDIIIIKAELIRETITTENTATENATTEDNTTTTDNAEEPSSD